MRREDLLSMAREAGMNTSLWDYGAGSMVFTMGLEGVARGAIERFAALVAAAEREACAKVVDDFGDEWMCDSHMLSRIIRARKDDE